jgi:hypothetical protein
MTKKLEVSLTYVILRRAQDDISFDGACPEPVEGLRMTFPSIRRRSEDNPTPPLPYEGREITSAVHSLEGIASSGFGGVYRQITA